MQLTYEILAELPVLGVGGQNLSSVSLGKSWPLWAQQDPNSVSEAARWGLSRTEGAT